MLSKLKGTSCGLNFEMFYHQSSFSCQLKTIEAKLLGYPSYKRSFPDLFTGILFFWFWFIGWVLIILKFGCAIFFLPWLKRENEEWSLSALRTSYKHTKHDFKEWEKDPWRIWAKHQQTDRRIHPLIESLARD